MSKVEDCRPSDLSMSYGRVKWFNDKYARGSKNKLFIVTGYDKRHLPHYTLRVGVPGHSRCLYTRESSSSLLSTLCDPCRMDFILKNLKEFDSEI